MAASLLAIAEPRSTWRTVDERFVWWLWQTRRFDSRGARDQGFDIVFPGWFSTGAGPDFRDAMIADASGRLIQGDIEIHVTDSAWRAHGHDGDPAYNSVILHVVLFQDSALPTLTQSGDRVPVLELEPLLQGGLDVLHAGMANWQPAIVRCPTHHLDHKELLQTVLESGRHRFQEKVRRMVANVEALGPDEALYRDVAEALGYSANRAPFRKIAEALPFGLLSSLTLFQTEQLLLMAAGLSQRKSLLTAYIEGPVLQPGELTTFRIRPSNQPAARLRGLARLIDANRRGFAGALLDRPVSDLWQLFCASGESPLVGRGRADDIVLNVALPYLAAYCSADGDEALASLPAPSGNRWVTALREKLAASGLAFKPFRAIHHLGLLDLSTRFCRFDHCEACPLHNELSG